MLGKFILKDSLPTLSALDSLAEMSVQHVRLHFFLFQEDFLADNTGEPGAIHHNLLLSLLGGLLLVRDWSMSSIISGGSGDIA